MRAASPALSNVNARLAIQCAISRKDVIDSAALGAGDVTGPITSPEFKSDPNAQPCPTQDLAKAKATPEVEDFFAVRMVAYLRPVLSHMRNGLLASMASGLLTLAAVRT